MSWFSKSSRAPGTFITNFQFYVLIDKNTDPAPTIITDGADFPLFFKTYKEAVEWLAAQKNFGNFVIQEAKLFVPNL